MIKRVVLLVAVFVLCAGNALANIDQNISQYVFDGRELKVYTTSDIDRIDIHGTFDGAVVNAPLVYDGHGVWSMALWPTINHGTYGPYLSGPHAEFFFNYDIDGVGINTETFVETTLEIDSLYQLHQIIRVDGIGGPFLSYDIELWTTALADFDDVYIYYQINGGPLQGALMVKEENGDYTHKFGAAAPQGSHIDYFYMIFEDGVGYASGWESVN